MAKSEYFLYGADRSVYTGKARSYFRKKGLNFETRPTSHPGPQIPATDNVSKNCIPAPRERSQGVLDVR